MQDYEPGYEIGDVVRCRQLGVGRTTTWGRFNAAIDRIIEAGLNAPNKSATSCAQASEIAPARHPPRRALAFGAAS